MNKQFQTLAAVSASIALTSAFAALLFPSTALAGPSKAETIEFILDKLGTESGTNPNSGYKWTITKECSLNLLDNGSPSQYIPLSKLSEFEVSYLNGSSRNTHDLYFLTMHCGNGAECIRSASSGYAWADKSFSFRSQETPTKLAKALSHLKALCAGKKSDLF